MEKYFAHRFSVAPMLDWTDRHCRYFHRLLTRHTLLYTEMVTTGALIHARDSHRFLWHDSAEHPVAIQLGGSSPSDLALCARRAEDAGFDEVNLNVGCPSDRVQSGRFGACLMADPSLVARCVEAMQSAVNVPVTVKTRIGIDNQDSWEFFHSFVSTVRSGGCGHFIVHARKAWLQGLSPKENREKPPLHYDFAYRIKEEFSDLQIVLNGNVCDLEQAKIHLEKLDGVMLGRAAYENPSLLLAVDRELFGEKKNPIGENLLWENYTAFMARGLAAGVPLQHMTKPLMGFYQSCRGAKNWRRILAEEACRPGADEGILFRALQEVL